MIIEIMKIKYSSMFDSVWTNNDFEQSGEEVQGNVTEEDEFG